MAIHHNFPKSPHVILEPNISWFPADETLRESSYEKARWQFLSITYDHVFADGKKFNKYRPSDFNNLLSS